MAYAAPYDIDAILAANFPASAFYPARTQMLGAVANGCMAMGTYTATYKQAQFALPLIAMDQLTSLQVLFPNWYVNGAGTELGPGSASNIRASIEYPAGTFTQLTFSGVAQGSIPDVSSLLSDACAVMIPKGALFWVVGLFENATGIIYSAGNANPYFRARTAFAASGLADPTSTGNIPRAPAVSVIYGPSAVIGQTRSGPVLLIGDSRSSGQGDVPSGEQLGMGLSRVVGTKRPVMNMGRGGLTVQNTLASCVNRIALAQYASDVWLQLGVNDLPGRTAVQVEADLASLAALVTGGKNIWLSTYEPYQTTSSDIFATVANQTVGAYETKRAAMNTWALGVPAGFTGCLDVCAAVESGGTNATGKWNAPNYTADGTHATRFGAIAQRDFGAGELLNRA